jgi:glycogen debranching enzyme
MLQSRYPSEYPQVIPTFSLHWISMLEDWYWQTGDTTLLKRYRSTMDGVLDYFDRHIGESGLTEFLGYWEITDWAEAWEHRHGVPFAVDQGPCTMSNLCYALALQTAARMAPLMGRPALAEDYLARAEAILSNIRQLCYDPARGLFREGPAMDEYTQHSQVLAVLTGLVTGEEAKRLMNPGVPGTLMLTVALVAGVPIVRPLSYPVISLSVIVIFAVPAFSALNFKR